MFLVCNLIHFKIIIIIIIIIIILINLYKRMGMFISIHFKYSILAQKQNNNNNNTYTHLISGAFLIRYKFILVRAIEINFVQLEIRGLCSKSYIIYILADKKFIVYALFYCIYCISIC